MPAVEQCPYREDVQLTAESDESACCGLLRRILNCGEELPAFRVPRRACAVCIDGIPPSADRLNPVLASFLYSAASQLSERGGTAACSAERAVELREWAKSFVDVEFAGVRATSAEKRSYRLCCHLGQIAGYRQVPSIHGLVRTAVHRCHHPAHEMTTEECCNRCLDWSRTNASAAKLADQLPRPASWCGRGPIQWAVGMTTARRQTPTLEPCLDSLGRAGWDVVQLAVDGSSRLPAERSPENISLRSPAVGAWPNFYLTLLELILSRPDADAILMLQDDAQFYDREDVRAYLDSVLWPSDPPGIISLYCSAAYTRATPGWSVADQRWEWGALAFVFPADLARRFVCDPVVIQHRWTDRGLRFIDDVIGEWATRNTIPIWYPSPSLVQHIGETSTVWPGVPAAGFRRADLFAGDL